MTDGGRIAAISPLCGRRERAINAGMRSVFGHFALKTAAMLAALAQVAIAAASAGGDPARLICAPSGSLSSPQAQAALSEFLHLYGEEAPEDGVLGEHCPICAQAHASPSPTPPTVTAPVFAAADARWPSASAAAPTPPKRGPPLGGRAPPLYL